MTPQATLAWQSATALAATLACSTALAATVNARIAFPGHSAPAATLYVRNLDSQVLHQQALKRGEEEVNIDVPAGRYWIFIRSDEPGLTELYGAHTQFSLCSRSSDRDDAADCTDHALAEVEVPAGNGAVRAEVDDWMLSDAAATELDRILGSASAATDNAELGRPRFSEYRVARDAGLQPVVPDLASAPGAGPLAAQLQEAALAGSNFAGRFTLVRVACGEQCERVAIIDQADGAILFPEPLSQAGGALPCRAEQGLDFRDDSRLLEFSRREGELVVTDYLLWDSEQRKFASLAQDRRSLERFCAGAAQ